MIKGKTPVADLTGTSLCDPGTPNNGAGRGTTQATSNRPDYSVHSVGTVYGSLTVTPVAGSIVIMYFHCMNHDNGAGSGTIDVTRNGAVLDNFGRGGNEALTSYKYIDESPLVGVESTYQFKLVGNTALLATWGRFMLYVEPNDTHSAIGGKPTDTIK